jgi:hypothetical protein
MVPIQFDPELHTVADTAFGSYLRQHLKDPLLFTYHHKRTKNWVVAAWLNHPYGRMLELAILGKTPAGTRDIVRSIETMVVSNPDGERTRRENRKNLRNFDRWADEEELEQTKQSADAIEFLRRRARHEKKHFVVNG